MTWKNKIAGCFGETDLIFAGHPNDEARAFDLLTTLRKENIGWREASEAIRKFLEGKGAAVGHIKAQIAKVSAF